MSNFAIVASGVGKQYQIGAVQMRHNTLRDAIASSAGRLWSSMKSLGNRSEPERFWALQDVSFELREGEVLGIIGRNGAGKSTLLKILSRITEPTTGEIAIRGRVGSLLEVGTGFHSELTGRENIFLNGAILGMTRSEIERKFEEIVDFAEIERFIDTPVKHYSSGMYLRLGFAVAAHLEPEILIVDEVLAVGDAEFQRKCLGKMGDVAREGRTVIFVSHNLAAIRTMCSRGILLEHGIIRAAGSIDYCLAAYAATRHQHLSTTWVRPKGMPTLPLTIDRVALGLSGAQPDLLLQALISLSSNSEHKDAFLAVDIRSLDGTPVMQALPRVDPFIFPVDGQHNFSLRIRLPGLVPGQYCVTVWAGSHNESTLDLAEDVASFEVYESPSAGRSYPHTADHGYIVPTSTVVAL